MGRSGVRVAEKMIKDIIAKINNNYSGYNYDSYYYSRIGIIAYANSTTTVRSIGYYYGNNTIPYLGEDNSDLLNGFAAAQRLVSIPTVSNHKKVIVIIASTYTGSGGQDDPIAQEARRFAGKVITVQYQQNGVGAEGLGGLATKPFNFVNDDREVENVIAALLHINCFCRPSLKTLSTNYYGSVDSSCVSYNNLQTDANDATDDCHEEGSELVKIDSQAKQDALDALATGNKRYWIGLRFNAARNQWYWPDWSIPSFSLWAYGPYNYYGVDYCAYSENGRWYPVQCTPSPYSDSTDRFFFCESKPCSASNNCFNTYYYPPAPPPLPTTDEPTNEPVTGATEQPEFSTEGPTEPPFTGTTEEFVTAAAGETTTSI